MVRELASGDRPWRTVLREEPLEVPQVVLRWLDNIQRGAFFRLMAPPGGTAFLAVGDESGIISACLAEDYERGLLAEARPVVSEFLAHRFRLDSIDNVVVVREPTAALSLSDGPVGVRVVPPPP